LPDCRPLPPPPSRPLDERATVDVVGAGTVAVGTGTAGDGAGIGAAGTAGGARCEARCGDVAGGLCEARCGALAGGLGFGLARWRMAAAGAEATGGTSAFPAEGDSEERPIGC
jgi:hypothetical protein